mgnify:CR=1 FL=1
MANFVVSGTPHVRSKESIQSIMRDVIIALVPATAAGIYYFGLRALILIVAAIISAVFFEWLYEKITKKPVTINDLSAVVTGLLLAMNLPASAPVWVAIVGSAFAIIFAKQLFGGLGQNFINPALAGRAFLLASYPTEMTTWVVPNGLAADAATYATPLAQLKNGTLDNLWDTHAPFQIDGNFGGTAGVTEMLLQSHMGFIQLLPALPDAWKDGLVSGLCAKGNFEVSISWKNNRLDEAILVSKAGTPCTVRYGDKTLSFKTIKGKVYKIKADGDKLMQIQ